MGNNDTNVTNSQPNVIIIDTLKAHCSKMGKIGGKSKSEAKMLAMRANLAKARFNRHRRVYNRYIIPNNSNLDKVDPNGPNSN